MVHRLVQPRRPDRRHGGDRLRRGDLPHVAAEPALELPELGRLAALHLRLHHPRSRGDQHVQGPDHGDVEHRFGLVAHGGCGLHRRRPRDRARPSPVGQLRFHEDDQQHRVLRSQLQQHRLLVRLRHRASDGPVHDHRLRRLRPHERGDEAGLAWRGLGAADVRRRLGVLRLHPARRRDLCGAGRRRDARGGRLRRAVHLGHLTRPPLGGALARSSRYSRSSSARSRR